MAKNKVNYSNFSLTSVVIGLVIGLVAGYGLRSMQSSSAATRNVSGASISIATSDPTPPKLGSKVTFTTQVPKLSGPKNPSINVNCFQGDKFVWGDTGSLTQTYIFGGSSSPWTVSGGSANCTANLVNIYWKNGMEQIDWLATYSFTTQ